MKLKIRELSYIERALLVDVISALSEDNLNVAAAIEVLARVLEIEGEPLHKEKVAGLTIRKLSDAQLEKLLAELTPEEISRILLEALEKNKLFFGRIGGTDTEGS